jgi:protein-disulfide isomerase
MTKKRSTATRRAEAGAAAERAAAIRAEHERKERRRRSLVVTAAVLAVVVVVGVIAYIATASKDSTTASGSAPAGGVGAYAVPAGPSSAPVKVTVYEDFMCPYCGQFEAASRSTFAKDISAGTVQFQYHVLNFLDRSSTTDYSTRSANALAVVLDASGATVAKKFHDLLFEHQPEEGSAGLSDDQLVQYAVQAGATGSEVRPGIEGKTYENWVDKVTDRSSKDGVTGTPTVLIDGKKVASQSTDGLVSAIQSAVDAG